MLLVGLFDRYGDKSICQINSYIPGTRGCVTLLKQWNHIWYSTWILHCESLRYICLLHRLNRLAEWGCDGNHHPCVFQVLHGGTNLCSHSGNALQLWVYCFLRKGSYNNFCLVFPTIIAFTPHVREPIWGFCQLLSISILMMHSRTG